MQTINDFKYFYQHQIQPIVTIGSFDGLHLGHQKLIRETICYAKNRASLTTVLSFNPLEKLNGAGVSGPIFSSDQKTRALEELGVDFQIPLSLDQELRKISHQDFFWKYLLGNLRAKAIFVGNDFRFGFKRLGDIDFLKESGKKHDIQITAIEPVLFRGSPISSTRIRSAITSAEDFKDLLNLLGRPFSLEGKIIKGQQIASKLGTPTVNLGDIKQLYPSTGVYAGYVWLGEGKANQNAEYPSPLNPPLSEAIPSVFNVGHRPSLKESFSEEVCIEAHLLQGDYGKNNLYDLPAVFYFIERLRDEIKFSNISDLKAQIDKDKTIAKSILAKRTKVG